LALSPLVPAPFDKFFARSRKHTGLESTDKTLVITLVTSVPQKSGPDKAALHFATLRNQLMDAHGCVFPSTGVAMTGSRFERVYQFPFDQFPRNEPQLHFFVSSPSETQAVHLTVRNPLGSQTVERFPADKLPVSRTVGDLTFTLENTAAIFGNRRWFQLTRNGRLVDDWGSVDFEIEDSHGNPGKPRYCFESTCRVRALAWSNGNSPPARSNMFLRFEANLPPEGSILKLSIPCIVSGIELQLVALAAPGVYSISNNTVVDSARLSPMAVQGYTFTGYHNVNGRRVPCGKAIWTRYRLLFKDSFLPSNQKLIFRTKDERGRIGMLYGPKEGENIGSWRCFDLETHPDSQKVVIEGIIPECRVATFYIETAALTNSGSSP
jgi:hypothetical protein